MRTETQVLDQLLSFARDRDTIRAVVMNGSRVNPNAPKDLFQDYDVVYYVTDPRRYLEDQSWIAYFGELIILQQNDFSDHGLDGFIFLMLFSDGVRIDLSFAPLESRASLGEDSLTRVLMDKDSCIPTLLPASDHGYFTQRPTRKIFDETVNEIFWCSNNIAKGIWRDELVYSKFMFDEIVRPCVVRMLEWYAAMLHGWAITTGSYGKWLKKFLPPKIWDLYVSTYAGVEYEANWEALLKTCLLVRKIGMELAQHLGYSYPVEDDHRMVAYLERVRALPRDARDYELLPRASTR
jgi:aminoglycoside 6-adenylyltransferase